MLIIEKQSVGSTPQGRILVVDSDNTLCEMIRVHFCPEGFVVDSCTTADDVFSAHLAAYRLMIIDLDTNGGIGTGIIEQVKHRRDTTSLGVIACSVNMSPTTIIEILNAGADDYLLKPFSLQELKARVRSVLNHKTA